MLSLLTGMHITCCLQCSFKLRPSYVQEWLCWSCFVSFPWLVRYFANMNTHTHTKASSLGLCLWWRAITNPDHAPSLTPCSFCCAKGWGPVNAAPRLSGSKADTAHSVFSWDHWIIEDPLLRLNCTGFHHGAGGHFDFPLYAHHICNNAAEMSQF